MAGGMVCTSAAGAALGGVFVKPFQLQGTLLL
jgi:hypothetical protein